MKWHRKREEEREERAEAEEALDDAVAQWQEVRRVSKSLRDMRTKNHFASAIESIFRGSG